MNLPKLVHSSQFTVHSKKNSVIREPITVNRRSWRLGFTLIELLVVIAIIGILIAAATVSYTKAQQKARDNRRKSDLKSVQQALELYFQQNGSYPISNVNMQIVCGTAIDWGNSFTCNNITYMNPLPKDPTQTVPKNYWYFSSFSGAPVTYTISANLENTNDPEYCLSTGVAGECASKLPCDPIFSKSYCVKNP